MSLYCVIVFYNPSEECIANACRVSSICHTIVVDNSDTPVEGNVPFEYVFNNGNQGIAKAQNIGVQRAINEGASLLLFLDQDSILYDNSIKCLVREYYELKELDSTCVAVGPLIVNKTTGTAYKNSLNNEVRKKVQTIISSGMLVDSTVFDTVGLMEEKLFIDVVDHEWCWRCCSKGYSIYLTSNVKLLHKVGQKSNRFLGIEFLWAAPFRYYYKYRNSLWMMTRNYVPSRWKIRTMVRLLLDYFIFLVCGLFNSSKRKCAYYASRGIIDGIKKN